MAYTFSKDWYEKIECPFCSKGTIQIHHTLPVKSGSFGQVSGGAKFSSGRMSKEREEVQNDCHVCKTKRKEIQKKIDEGSLSKPPSRKEILKRMKDAGLPTKI